MPHTHKKNLKKPQKWNKLLLFQQLPENSHKTKTGPLVATAEHEEVNIKIQEEQLPVVGNHKTEEEWSCKAIARW